MIKIKINKKMEEKKNEIYEYYLSLAKEPRGVMGRFITWLVVNTGCCEGAVRKRIKENRWGPIERAAIMDAIRTGSWRYLTQ